MRGIIKAVQRRQMNSGESERDRRTQLPYSQSLSEWRAAGEAAGQWIAHVARGRRCALDHGRRLSKAAVLDLAHKLVALLLELVRAKGRPQRLEQ